jgi:hypothetical protein
MIKRLEEANARAHDKLVHPNEQVCVSEEDVARHWLDQQKRPAVPLCRTSRGGLVLGLICSLMATSFGVLALVWQSPYSEAAQRIFARWGLLLIQTKPYAPAPLADTASPELKQRLETMARDLANLAQGIDQPTTSEQQTIRDNAAVGALNAALSQMVRDNAAVAEQLKTAQSQMARDNAALVERLKAVQEQR